MKKIPDGGVKVTRTGQLSGGKYHVTGQNVVSADGKTMTQTAKGTDAAGKPITSISIFDKQ